MRRLLTLGAILFCTAQPAMAVPQLQLDIIGGTYDPLTETIVATSSTITLLAILTPKNNATQAQINALLAETYYISSAITPDVSVGTSLGSFTFGGVPFNVTGDMVFGTPPLDALEQFHDPGDLAKHGIFPTYFSEHAFQFSAANTTSTYNSQDSPGGGGFNPGGTGSYYAQIEIDVSNLNAGYGLHFDLYNTEVKNNGDIDVDDFAPFSHDAEVLPGPGPGPGPGIPEPATFLLLGAGLGLLRRRKSVQ